MPIVNHRCRSLDATVIFVIDTDLGKVTGADVVTKARPVTISLLNDDGTALRQVTIPPGTTVSRDFAALNRSALDVEVTRADQSKKRVISFPFKVDF